MRSWTCETVWAKNQEPTMNNPSPATTNEIRPVAT